MKEINIIIEGYNTNGICLGCLNYDRKMFYAENAKECFKTLADINVPDKMSMKVCWECLAYMKSVTRFKAQILKSFEVLMEYSKEHPYLNKPSDLTKYATKRLTIELDSDTLSQDCDIETKNEPIEIKKELDEEECYIDMNVVKEEDMLGSGPEVKDCPVQQETTSTVYIQQQETTSEVNIQFPELQNVVEMKRKRIAENPGNSPTTPEFYVQQSPSPRTPKRCRRVLPFRGRRTTKVVAGHDSGSDDEGYSDNEEEAKDDEEDEEATEIQQRQAARRLRDVCILEHRQKEKEEWMVEGREVEDAVWNEGEEGGLEVANGPVSETFSWSENFATFSGQEETYVRSPGPACKRQDPTDIFMLIWDLPIMEYIVEQTNKYANHCIMSKSEFEDGLTSYLLNWQDTTVDEMYRFFAILNLMSIVNFGTVSDYWSTGLLGMPDFRHCMSRSRFTFILRFLHFADNAELHPCLRSYDRKIFKISPIVEHCNKKFTSLYTPQRHLSLDESLLLWKGRHSFKQCNRFKAARFGIKSYDLCEAETGYLLRCILYAGKDSSMTEGDIHGFASPTAKVILKLMDGYLDTGHCLVMDNWYNQLILTRYLKYRRTDVIGTLNRRRQHVPPAIQNVDVKKMPRGDQIALHCGDISLIAWKDVKLVTTMSTSHNAERVSARRSGKTIMKPLIIVDYNKYMGGVDLKDQKLSAFRFKRTRGRKWYMKVFKRLLNTSLLNAYIMYSKNPLLSVMTHKQFRLATCIGLLERFPRPQVSRPVVVAKPDSLRLDLLHHYPGKSEETAADSTKKKKIKHLRRRCIRCSAIGKRTEVITRCKKCNVALCLEPCFEEYHRLAKL